MSNIFWAQYASELVESLTANSRLTEFTKNPAIIGAFAESAVSDLIRAAIGPSRCTTGTVISTLLTDQMEKLKQLDLIVWDSTPLPAVFDRAGFAMVPQQSVHGVIEVKRTAYSNVGKNIKETLDWVEKYVEGDTRVKPAIQTMIQQKGPSAILGMSSKQIKDPDPNHIGLGIVCLKLHGQTDKELVELVGAGRAVILQEMLEDGSIRTNKSHVTHLLEFLKTVRLRGEKCLNANGVSSATIAALYSETAPGSLKR